MDDYSEELLRKETRVVDGREVIVTVSMVTDKRWNGEKFQCTVIKVRMGDRVRANFVDTEDITESLIDHVVNDSVKKLEEAEKEERGELPMTYRKKPVEVYAIRFTRNNVDDIRRFTRLNAHDFNCGEKYTCIIDTLEGQHIATEGDYIIRGIKGEYYPCKPDIFEKTYDKVVDEYASAGVVEK